MVGFPLPPENIVKSSMTLWLNMMSTFCLYDQLKTASKSEVNSDNFLEKHRGHSLRQVKVLVPLLLVEFYLLLTVCLLYLGPVNWHIGNSSELLSFLAMYHIAFIAGYLIYLFFSNKNKSKQPIGSQGSSSLKEYIIKNYWLILVLAFIASLISYKNITMSDDLIPYTFFKDIEIGIVNPAYARTLYAAKLFSGEYKGNKFLTAALLFFSVFKYALIPLLVHGWPALTRVQKAAGVIVAMIPLLSGIVMSLSSINFFYMFTICISLFVIFLCNGKDGGASGILRRKGIVFSFIVIFLFSFWQFYAVKSGANIYQVVTGDVKPATFNYLEKYDISFKYPENDSFTHDFYVKLVVYLDQGYKGMALSLERDFDSTYGVGHSVFLQRVFEDYLGFNVRERTFQRKITDKWDENIFWHSAYSYFANDISFAGVPFILFLIGYSFAMVVDLAVNHCDLVAKLLLPLFGLMFLYLPANNQVFSFLETMSSFWLLSFLLVVTSRRRMLIKFNNALT